MTMIMILLRMYRKCLLIRGDTRTNFPKLGTLVCSTSTTKYMPIDSFQILCYYWPLKTIHESLIAKHDVSKNLRNEDYYISH